jgi:hypothetical protein
MDVRVRANDLSLASDRCPQIMYLNPHRARPLARRLPRPPKTATRAPCPRGCDAPHGTV